MYFLIPWNLCRMFAKVRGGTQDLEFIPQEVLGTTNRFYKQREATDLSERSDVEMNEKSERISLGFWFMEC